MVPKVPQENDTGLDYALALSVIGVREDGPPNPLTTVSMGQFSAAKSKTLKAIRDEFVANKTLNNALSRCPFSTKECSIIDDSTTLEAYLAMTSQEKDKKKEEEEKKEKKVEEKVTSSIIMHDLYMKQRKMRTNIDDNLKGFLNEKLNLDPTKDAVPQPKTDAPKLVSSYAPEAWKANAASKDAIHPTDMTESDWEVVNVTNSLLNGYVLQYDKHQPSSLIQASVYPAFVLKPRELNSYEKPSIEKVEVLNQNVRIPRFQVKDDSSIETLETKTAFQSSLAKGSFSSSSIEASAGGGAFGFSAGFKTGASESESDALAAALKKEKAEMHITYRFPRLTLFLDEECLELSKECLEDWKAAGNDYIGQNNFFDKYGHFFATRVELGGRLCSTHDSKTVEGSNAEEKASTLKIAASVSFSSPWVQASVSASHENQESSKNTVGISSLHTNINWEAHGGDTLLANNPPEWCQTVSSFYNWRVIHQYGMKPLEAILPTIAKRQDKSAPDLMMYSVRFDLRVGSDSVLSIGKGKYINPQLIFSDKSQEAIQFLVPSSSMNLLWNTPYKLYSTQHNLKMMPVGSGNDGIFEPKLNGTGITDIWFRFVPPSGNVDEMSCIKNLETVQLVLGAAKFDKGYLSYSVHNAGADVIVGQNIPNSSRTFILSYVRLVV